MRLPAHDGWLVRLVHSGVHLATRPLARLYEGPVPPDQLVEPEPFEVPIPGGAVGTYAWGAANGEPQAARIAARPRTVLVHGLNANARYWVGVASLLGRERRVLALDQRRHGTTGPLPGGVELGDTRGDLAAWLDTLQLPAVDLVGHSWGGKVCLDFAAAYPERVRRLVLVDPVPPQGLHPLLRRASPVAGAVFSPERGPFSSRAELEAAARRICWLRHAEPWMQRAFLANFRPDTDGGMRHVLDAQAFAHLYDHVLATPSPLPLDRVRMPVLLVRATYSAVPLPDQVRWLAERLPELQTVRLAGEHSLHAVNPVGLARVIDGFLSD